MVFLVAGVERLGRCLMPSYSAMALRLLANASPSVGFFGLASSEEIPAERLFSLLATLASHAALFAGVK